MISTRTTTVSPENSAVDSRTSRGIGAGRAGRRLFLIIWSSLILSSVTVLATAGDIATGASQEKSEPLVVGVSIPPQRFFVEQIAGPAVQTVVMIDKGHSPHHYSPTPLKLRELSKAAVYFASGVDGEVHWKEKFEDGNHQLKWIGTTAGHHQWLSPDSVRASAEQIADVLMELLPAQQSEIAKRRDDFLVKLDGVDSELERIFGTSVRGKSFLANHEAWASLSDKYGLNMLVINHEGKGASLRRMADLIKQARQLGIDTVIADFGHQNKSALQLAEAVNGKVVELDPMNERWIENMLTSARVIKGALR